MKKKIIWIIIIAVIIPGLIGGSIYFFYYKNVGADVDYSLSFSDGSKDVLSQLLLSNVKESLEDIKITEDSTEKDISDFKDDLVKKILEDCKKLAGNCSEIRGSINVTITTEKVGTTDDYYTIFVVTNLSLFKATKINGVCSWKQTGRIRLNVMQSCFQRITGAREVYCQVPEPNPVGKPFGKVIFRETIPIPGSGQPPVSTCCTPTPTATTQPPSPTNTYSPVPTTPRP